MTETTNWLDAALLQRELDKPAKRKYAIVPLTMEARKRYLFAHEVWVKFNYPAAVKDHGTFKTKIPLTYTPNGLTMFICNYITWCGYRATRINTVGGFKGGKRIFSTTRRGTADISATIKGRSCMFEIKIGKDKPSEWQLAEQTREIAAGGQYFFVHSPEEFFSIYDEII